ncbi:hypothetical protein QF037_006282 [Streptomyces canus]|uniref:hypothetical protein n=1 Tax=Streptomyces canus TaxID=58343 RepID=UPI002787DACE|nr:hypothetical protein [Streptomyces canus]MDQ0601937.1 hypothetical protein [Streptomyces canus]
MEDKLIPALVAIFGPPALFMMFLERLLDDLRRVYEAWLRFLDAIKGGGHLDAPPAPNDDEPDRRHEAEEDEDPDEPGPDSTSGPVPLT